MTKPQKQDPKTPYLLPTHERAAVAVALMLIGQGWPAEKAVTLVRQSQANRGGTGLSAPPDEEQ